MDSGYGAEGTLGGPAAGGPPAWGRGFTDADVQLLQEAHRCGMADRGWGRARFVLYPFAQYFAIWSADLAEQTPPVVSVVRFDRTGTYALLLNNRVVASGKSLNEILPTLAAAGSFAVER
jgi:hypothetical protein